MLATAACVATSACAKPAEDAAGGKAVAPEPAQFDGPAGTAPSTRDAAALSVTGVVRSWLPQFSGRVVAVGVPSFDELARGNDRFGSPELTDAEARREWTADVRADGSFVIDLPREGEYTLQLRSDDLAATSATVRMTLRDPVARAVLLPRTGSLTLRGTVLTAAGVPWHGTVAALDVPDVIEPVVWTSEGRFEFRNLPGQAGVDVGEVELKVISDGLVDSQKTLKFAHESSISVVVGAGPLREAVAILDPEGMQLRGACVNYSAKVDGWEERGQCLTDEQGRFRYAAGTSTVLDVVAPGVARASVRASGAEPLVIRVPRTATVRGRVAPSDGGGPAAGAIVRVEADGWRGDTTTAGPDGAFALDDLMARPAEIDVHVCGGGWESAGTSPGVEARTLQPPLAPGEVREVELPVVPSRTLRLMVRSSDGAAIPSALVELSPSEDERVGMRYRTDAQGTASIGDICRRHTRTATVSAPGFASEVREIAPAPDAVTAIEVVLEPAISVGLHVVDRRSGAPIRGAVVRPQFRRWPGQRRTPTAEPTATDASGECEILIAASDLADFRPQTQARGYFERFRAEPALVGADVRDTDHRILRVTLQPIVRFGGVLRHEDGTPVAGRQVQIVREDFGTDPNDSAPRLVSIDSDAEGRFSVGVAPGRLAVTVWPNESAQQFDADRTDAVIMVKRAE